MGFYSYLKHQVDIMVQWSFAQGVAFFVFFICLVKVLPAEAAEATTDPSEGWYFLFSFCFCFSPR